jgi:hypothetical protein
MNTLPPEASEELRKAIAEGLLELSQKPGVKAALIKAPPNIKDLSNEDLMSLLQRATVIGDELERLEYVVLW